MFTGIIEAVGQVRRLEKRGGDLRLSIACPDLDLRDVKLGDSIATQGVCLTVVDLEADAYAADVSLESLERSTLGRLRPGQAVNLEKALLPTTRLGGHIVSGHVDGIGDIVETATRGRALVFRVRVPVALRRYIAEKGSITVDGISLTTNELYDEGFLLTIVPHTIHSTALHQWQVGTAVNLEVDVLARYLERLMQQPASSTTGSAITAEFLLENGYMRRS